VNYKIRKKYIIKGKKIKFETIKKSLDFKNIIRYGEQVENDNFKLVININDNINDIVRLGYIINKKIGNAVIRNRTKRIIKEILRSLNKKNKKSLDLIVIAKKPISNLTIHVLKEQIQNCIKNYLN